MLTQFVDEIVWGRQVEFPRNQLLIKYSAFIRYWRRNWECNRTVHQPSGISQENEEELELNGTHQILVYSDNGRKHK
jgi:hypothetical protein